MTITQAAIIFCCCLALSYIMLKQLIGGCTPRMVDLGNAFLVYTPMSLNHGRVYSKMFYYWDEETKQVVADSTPFYASEEYLMLKKGCEALVQEEQDA